MNLKNIPQIKYLDSGNFFLLAGPCAIESEEMAMIIAEKLVSITDKLQIPYVFKGSFKKANRSRIDSFSGIGDEKALKILRKISETFGTVCSACCRRIVAYIGPQKINSHGTLAKAGYFKNSE